MTLHIDIETSTDVEIKEIGITRANEYTEISLGKSEKKRSEGITHYSFWITRNTSAILSLADEISINLSDDTEVTGYSISVDGIAINRPIVFVGDWVEIPDKEDYQEEVTLVETEDVSTEPDPGYSLPIDMNTVRLWKDYVTSQTGEGFAGLPNEFFKHTYRAMKDYGMSVYDADKWAWLNTLFGYDIGADRALSLITWYDDNGMDVLELSAGDKESLKNVAEMELGLHFNYAAFPDKTPDAISYIWPEYLAEKTE